MELLLIFAVLYLIEADLFLVWLYLHRCYFSCFENNPMLHWYVSEQIMQWYKVEISRSCKKKIKD